MRQVAACAVATLILAACPDTTKVDAITPQIEIPSESLDFGTVRVGKPAELPLTLVALSRSSVAIVSLAVEDDPDAPGGGQAFTLPEPVDSVDGDSQRELTVRFTPDVEGARSAFLRVESDDPDPEDTVRRVKLSGRGGLPQLVAQPFCAPPCTLFPVVASPPSIDFGARPALRTDSSGRVINEPVWPTVTFANQGDAPLEIASASFVGSPGFRSIPALDLGGRTLEVGDQLSYRLAFDPQDESATPYAADLVVVSDDPDAPETRVHLTGTLAPNQAPQACASIVEVLEPDGDVEVPEDASGKTAFGGTVLVGPSDHTLVKLSAFSDHFEMHPDEASQGDLSKCTTDPEDGREALSYSWTLAEKPAHSVASLSGASGPEVSLQPEAYGRYALDLRVTDPDGASTSTEVAFVALPARDIAAELTWDAPGVDLDLHLVKPGSCSGRASCFFSRLGDASPYTLLKSGGVLDWGEAGKDWDDPTVDTRDSGTKGLVESVSLSRPESDPACATAACSYELYVHYMADGRAGSATATACPGKPCQEGASCGCPVSGQVCVSGRCVAPVPARLRLFLQPTASRPNAVLTVPLDPEVVALAGPCFAWHVATITWPSKVDVQTNPNAQVTVGAVGSAGAREFGYYGTLPATSFACQPNTPSGTPDEDVTYLQAQPPSYP